MFNTRRTIVSLLATIAVVPVLTASAPAQIISAAAPSNLAPSIFDRATPSSIPAIVEAAPAADQFVAPATPAPAVAATPTTLSPEQSAAIECIAKVVRHEAANQPLKGQLAVAQLIMHRVQIGARFGHSACAVVNQPGQFFNTGAYNPDRSSSAWSNAVAVSRDAVAHVSPEVTPGALFYHAAYQAPPRFFRSRQRVAVLGDHIFYR